MNYGAFLSPGLHPGVVCGAPLGRGNDWCRTQGFTLGWYAAPRWGAKTDRCFLSQGNPGMAGVRTLGRENDQSSAISLPLAGGGIDGKCVVLIAPKGQPAHG